MAMRHPAGTYWRGWGGFLRAAMAIVHPEGRKASPVVVSVVSHVCGRPFMLFFYDRPPAKCIPLMMLQDISFALSIDSFLAFQLKPPWLQACMPMILP